MAAKVKCPCCNRKQAKRPGDEKDIVYRCTCGALFDANPDEGGDYADHRPDIRLEREERERERRRPVNQQLMNRFNRNR